MISSNFSIKTFTESLKNEDSQTVISMAVQEATEADRLILKKQPDFNVTALQDYSRQLKKLINYHRYVVKPRLPKETTYNLYVRYWGAEDSMGEC